MNDEEEWNASIVDVMRVVDPEFVSSFYEPASRSVNQAITKATDNKSRDQMLLVRDMLNRALARSDGLMSRYPQRFEE